MSNVTIVLLNGASSSGKTSIAKELQRILDEPFLHVEVDMFGPMLPRRYFVGPQSNWVPLDPPADSLTAQAFFLQTVKAGDETLLKIKAGPIGRRLVAGIHATIAALAREGNNIIFVDVLYDPEYLKSYLKVLQDFVVWFVGVRSPLEVIEQRERARGDRLVGHTRGHFHLVHAHGLYDIEVDTSVCTPEECARQIQRRLQIGLPPNAFEQLRKMMEMA